jgi:syntaxin 5
MGKLFSQMSTLVMQQSEVITRIEDDVEAGLAETSEAHESMLYFHEITKGNRALIFKVFGLLIFFIVLFLYFT